MSNRKKLRVWLKPYWLGILWGIVLAIVNSVGVVLASLSVANILNASEFVRSDKSSDESEGNLNESDRRADIRHGV